MNRTYLRSSATAAAALTIALSLTACGAANENNSDGGGSDSKLSGTLNGAGSSAQEAAVAAWKKEFQTSNPDVTVNYDPVGSGGGREQFLAGGVAFAGSDSYLTDEELATAKTTCKGDIVEIPTYVSPIAVIYNLEGVDKLNLSPKTVGSIFEGKVTTWNDPAITADNPDAALPDSAITAVHRSDDSGTTENFTDYLDQAGEGSWTGGKAKAWPIKDGEAAEGTSGVVAAVSGGQGTIGYADESQAGDLGKASVKVGDSFTDPTAEAAAKIVDSATPVDGRGDTDIAVDIDRKSSEAGVYPIVLASYQMACQKYDDAAQADLVKAWLSYVISEDGQAAAAKSAGSAPLSSDFSSKAQAAIATIAGA